MAEKKRRPPRADAVRSRREKRGKRIEKAQKRIFDATAPPAGKTAQGAPVLMRGATLDVPVQKKKKARVRKRVDISLGASGAEVQLPPVPFLQPSWRWLSALLAAGLLVVLGMLFSYPAFLVETIEIKGLQRLDAREIHLVLGLQDAPIVALNPAVMENDLLQAFPEFRSVAVRVGLPNEVSIEVDERQPVLGWLNAQGLVLVDETGFSFPARGLVTDAGEDSLDGGQRLPVIEAPNLIMAPPEDADPLQTLNPYVGRQLLTAGQVAGILKISEKAPPGARILFDPAHGIGWEDPAGWIVYFGPDGGDISAKLQMYATIVLDLQSRDIFPAFISIEYLHAPYYRMTRE